MSRGLHRYDLVAKRLANAQSREHAQEKTSKRRSAEDHEAVRPMASPFPDTGEQHPAPNSMLAPPPSPVMTRAQILDDHVLTDTQRLQRLRREMLHSSDLLVPMPARPTAFMHPVARRPIQRYPEIPPVNNIRLPEVTAANEVVAPSPRLEMARLQFNRIPTPVHNLHALDLAQHRADTPATFASSEPAYADWHSHKGNCLFTTLAHMAGTTDSAVSDALGFLNDPPRNTLTILKDMGNIHPALTMHIILPQHADHFSLTEIYSAADQALRHCHDVTSLGIAITYANSGKGHVFNLDICEAGSRVECHQSFGWMCRGWHFREYQHDSSSHHLNVVVNSKGVRAIDIDRIEIDDIEAFREKVQFMYRFDNPVAARQYLRKFK